MIGASSAALSRGRAVRRRCACARMARTCVVLLLVFLVAGCATPASRPTVVGRSDDFLLVRATPSDTYESLAAEFLSDASLAPVLADANASETLNATRLVVVPLRPLNPSGVNSDGYQAVPILAYHQFTRKKPANLMEVTDTSFQQQMDYLKSAGYRVITLGELAGFLRMARPIPQRAVVITIDDGYHSVYDVAYPILKAHGFRATLFVYTDFVGARLGLTWDQIKEMDASGVIDVQSHSKSHGSMSRSSTDISPNAYAMRVTREITVPEGLLRERLGKSIDQFAYPYGDSSSVVVSALNQRHYGTAVTVWRGANPSFTNPLMLRRDMVYSDYSLDAFKKLLKVYQPADLR
jgi:peptidoglycan/xylan/chitin deacetylase (PgdA/CDA1 family)